MPELTRDANKIIVPVLPSDIDIHAASRCIADLLLVAKIKRAENRIGVIANRVRKNTLMFQSLMRFLEKLEIPIVATMRDSQNYVRAAEQGVGIHEMKPYLVKEDMAPVADAARLARAGTGAGRAARPHAGAAARRRSCRSPPRRSSKTPTARQRTTPRSLPRLVRATRAKLILPLAQVNFRCEILHLAGHGIAGQPALIRGVLSRAYFLLGPEPALLPRNPSPCRPNACS